GNDALGGNRGGACPVRLMEWTASLRKRPTPNPQRPTLNAERLPVLGSTTGRWPVVRGSLPRTCVANTVDVGNMHSAGCRMLQAGSLCSHPRGEPDHR